MQQIFSIFVLICMVAFVKAIGIPNWTHSPCGLSGMFSSDAACIESNPRPVDFRYVPDYPRPQRQRV